MNANELKQTLTELAACAEAWQPQARLVGNVTAGAIYEAAHRALEAVEFVEQHAQHHADAVERAGHEENATRILDVAADVLEDGAWATRVGWEPR